MRLNAARWNGWSGQLSSDFLTKRKVVTISRRERMSERWQALGVGPQRKVRIDLHTLTTAAALGTCDRKRTSTNPLDGQIQIGLSCGAIDTLAVRFVNE